MKAKKDPEIFLKHILESIGEIERNIKNTLTLFANFLARLDGLKNN